MLASSRFLGVDRDLPPARVPACCRSDLTEKAITPLGGFPHYGEVNEDYVPPGSWHRGRDDVVHLRTADVAQSHTFLVTSGVKTVYGILRHPQEHSP